MRTCTYLKINKEDEIDFDDLLKVSKFKSRTEFVTVCVNTFLKGVREPRHEDLDPELLARILRIRSRVERYHETKEKFNETLRRMAFPTLAMYGSKAVMKNLEEDLRREMLEMHDILVDKEEMKEYLECFVDENYLEIEEYRANVYRERYGLSKKEAVHDT